MSTSEIVHIVLFDFKPTLTWAQQEAVTAKMLSLQHRCIHPTTNKPYIKSAVGGTDNSIEGLSNGFSHAFVVTFESKEDRDYYVKSDEAHIGFVKELGEVLEKALVIDFNPGVFVKAE